MAEREVFITSDAERDLEEIADYIERHDSREKADYVYERIKETILKLETLPSSGRIVPELKDVGVSDFREVLFKPYRMGVTLILTPRGHCQLRIGTTLSRVVTSAL